MPAGRRRALERACTTGQWLSVFPQTRNNTSIGKDEFRDGLCMQYHYQPANLPKKCDGCNKPFKVEHALQCKKGWLVIMRHNDIASEIGALASLAYGRAAVRDEQIINTSHDAAPTKQEKSSNLNDNKGDVMIRWLWKKMTQAILDIRVTDLDAKSYCSKTVEKVLATQEREKKKKLPRRLPRTMKELFTICLHYRWSTRKRS